MSDIEKTYQKRYDDFLKCSAMELQKYLSEIVEAMPRIDRVSARAKSVDRFVAKSKKTVTLEDGVTVIDKYKNPLEEIQDHIGARIIVFYLEDVKLVAEEVKKRFSAIESSKIEPVSEHEFGYFGEHFILPLPTETTLNFDDETPKLFELQIKTLYQHAWSEAEHDLSYKPPTPLTREQKRKMAFTSAQSWGADRVFNELAIELGFFHSNSAKH
jgi:putative GTP pyrophosphokinase